MVTESTRARLMPIDYLNFQHPYNSLLIKGIQTTQETGSQKVYFFKRTLIGMHVLLTRQ
jgi:hypothetical protein